MVERLGRSEPSNGNTEISGAIAENIIELYYTTTERQLIDLLRQQRNYNHIQDGSNISSFIENGCYICIEFVSNIMQKAGEKTQSELIGLAIEERAFLLWGVLESSFIGLQREARAGSHFLDDQFFENESRAKEHLEAGKQRLYASISRVKRIFVHDSQHHAAVERTRANSDTASRVARGGAPMSGAWPQWVAELVSYIHSEGVPEGAGTAGGEALIKAIAEALAERGIEPPSRSTVQPVVRAVLARLRE